MNSEVGTVFIVDDAREVRNSLSRLLNTAGYRIQAFESAETFLRGQHRDAHGCLLLDISLPGLSGMELQRQLVDSPYARPIVFLTGGGDIRTSVDAMKAGAVDFLTKPIESPRLFAAVNQALQRDAVFSADPFTVPVFCAKFQLYFGCCPRQMMRREVRVPEHDREAAPTA
jgi:FixJ family two-component response regulator